MKKITVVTSLYKSRAYIPEFYRRIKDCIVSLGLNYQLVFVNDGSPDDSVEVVKQLMEHDTHITLVNLSRNFGQYPAMFAGMRHALQTKPDYVFILDVDLEEAPENLAEFYTLMQTKAGTDVVYGIVKKRQGFFVKKVLGNLFLWVLDKLSEHQIPRNQAWARLMKPNYLQHLLQYNEADTYPVGLMHLTGFNQVPCSIDKPYKGSTTYSWRKRAYAALSAVTSFSSRALLYIAFMGFGIFFFSVLFILSIVVQKLAYTDFQAGWSSIIASIWCIGGLIIFCLGVIGMYIAQIFNQVKNRPLYIIKSVMGKTE
ncbi:glycosyltransferase family 2 protein [uncultured Microscilla sp.]|uniref:glycosyltransferase family 2 protein n=1 Tax=uncultured Microscilla sp. TaxID=432653 RepID=UPI002612A793|nr:glycosyltransferase family 2 protein [uncultured Microscilla sp.]